MECRTYKDLIDDEDVVIYGVVVMTEDQIKKGIYSADCLTIEADSFVEAKGIAKGALISNKDYMYATVIESTYNYDYDGTLVFSNAQLVYSIWASEEKKSRFKQTKINKNYS